MIAISDKFLKNQLQCFHLYHCFHEAGDVDICKTIEQSVTLSNKKIDLSNCDTKLTASDVECVTIFLTSSFHKEWVGLDLSNSFLQDHSLHILHRGLRHCSDVTINDLWLQYTGLTRQSASLISELELTVKCKVKRLVIAGNDTVGEADEQLYSMLANSSTTMLETLDMGYTNLSSRATIALFNVLKDNNKLKVLIINYNAITDDACDAIATALEKNSCLVELHMHCNPLTGEAMVNIVNSLKANDTLAKLWLPNCCEDIMKRISSLQEIINKKRESRGCQVKLAISYNY